MTFSEDYVKVSIENYLRHKSVDELLDTICIIIKDNWDISFSTSCIQQLGYLQKNYNLTS